MTLLPADGRNAPPAPDVRALTRRLAQHCATYKGADTRRSVIQLAVTAGLFLALCAAMMSAAQWAWWAGILLGLPAAGLIVRLFIIQHDCGHGSYFRSRLANDMVGRAISIATLTPYGLWSRAHAQHHATSGHLGRRGVGDIDTLTVREFQTLGRWARLRYRLYRHPLVLLLVGPPYHFIINQRLPFGQAMPFREIWLSVLALDLAIVVVFGGLVAAIGVHPLLTVYAPVMVTATWIGGWLFYIQHQIADAYWAHAEDWDLLAAAFLGSSYYVLPPVLRWFTGNIGLHHVHHLCSRIPNYRLQECLDASPELKAHNRLTLRQSLACARLALWDEERGRMVPFAALPPPTAADPPDRPAAAAP